MRLRHVFPELIETMKAQRFNFQQITCHLFALVLMVFITTQSISLVFANVDDQNPLAALPQHCYFSSEITQTKTEASLPIPLKSTGKIYFFCQAGLIWQTIVPIEETLIFSGKHYQFKQNDSKSLQRLNSQEMSFLSDLMLGIMKADQDYIVETFDIETISDTTFKLLPIQSFLKKAIAEIKIQILDNDAITIEIQQTNDTNILIESITNNVLDESLADQSHCETFMPKAACTALYKPQLAANTLVK